jgi:hypothetical protein
MICHTICQISLPNSNLPRHTPKGGGGEAIGMLHLPHPATPGGEVKRVGQDLPMVETWWTGNDGWGSRARSKCPSTSCEATGIRFGKLIHWEIEGNLI